MSGPDVGVIAPASAVQRGAPDIRYAQPAPARMCSQQTYGLGAMTHYSPSQRLPEPCGELGDSTDRFEVTTRALTGALPEYEHPPVSEVALTIQLDRAIGFRSLDLAEISACWADELPNVQERDRLPMLDADPDDPEMTLELGERLRHHAFGSRTHPGIMCCNCSRTASR